MSTMSLESSSTLSTYPSSLTNPSTLNAGSSGVSMSAGRAVPFGALKM